MAPFLNKVDMVEESLEKVRNRLNEWWLALELKGFRISRNINRV